MLYRLGWLLSQMVRLFFPLKVINKKNFIKKGRCVGICNHYTNTDVPLVAINFCRKFNFLAKKELFAKKSQAWLYRQLGAIPVDRDKMDLSTLKAALSVLKKEQLLMLFPEGTRNKDNLELKGIKAGAGMFAVKGKAPIVPMALYRPPKVFKKNYLYIGKPVDLSAYYERKLNPTDMDEIGDIIYNSLRDTREELVEIIENKKRKRNKKEVDDNGR